LSEDCLTSLLLGGCRVREDRIEGLETSFYVRRPCGLEVDLEASCDSLFSLYSLFSEEPMKPKTGGVSEAITSFQGSAIVSSSRT
jgi:hypothetical protein